MSMLKFTRLPFLMMITLLSVTTFVGCNDDDPEGPDGTEVTVPKKGSTYTYTEYEVDEQGNKDESTEQEVVAEVEATGISIAGRTGALKFSETYEDGESDTAYVVYESNGDMSVLLGIEDLEDVDPIWITIPFGSKTAKNYTLNDTIDDGSGGTVAVSMAINTKYVRAEKATIQGKELDIWVGEITMNGTFPSPFGGTITVNSTGTVFFAPEIGYVYKNDDTTSFGLGSSRMIRLLVSYSLAS